MDDLKLNSLAEKKAELAESLTPFSGIKLLHIKRQLISILGQIGKGKIFDEYTKHDISHIDYMLASLEWIIPDETKELLTPSDWLMIVLSIYFHDLGMLVTNDEYKLRNSSYFSTFKREIFDGKYGLDYKEKIHYLEADTQDRFIYQELVRKTHAERIKYWILEEKNPLFSKNIQVIEEIKKLIGPLDNMFKRDLALICESHHLSDLDNFDKYKTNQPYGPTSEMTVNLLYAAVILRTADLLHITSDRTPSVEFRLINPTDPTSQLEWAKQRAVRSIRPQTKKNKDGNLDETLPKDALEIIAMFDDEKGFFGLISYLRYANTELQNNFQIIESSKKQCAARYSYPWKHIDDSNIETVDFEKRQFEFVLDQPRILDLLVGHTLYNDSTVVLRELTQNALDAIKLKKYEYNLQGSGSVYNPEIKVEYKPDEKLLIFSDNGTGMTLEIIQNHLLKVGSSRYQEEKFKKKFPDFSPISRFGIGLLTCFLVADDIDIITKSVDSEKAILLMIRKVHGKYLLKYCPPEDLDILQVHGTKLCLHLRADIDLTNIEQSLKKWVLFPNCKMSLYFNNTIIPIGFNNPSDLLINYLKELGIEVDNINFKVEEFKIDDVTLAIAFRYIEYFKEWEFLEFRRIEKTNVLPTGTCIEGIRVDFNTPGYNGRNILALANTVGFKAPKTNVARSNFESTPERGELLVKIYQLYLKHITNEINNLKKSFSISWAASEAAWLLRSLEKDDRYSNERTVNFEDEDTFIHAVSDFECILIEKNFKRELITINQLKNLDHFWTIDCASYNSADSLIKEIKASDASALSLLQTIYGNEDSKTSHIDYLLCRIIRFRMIEKIFSNNFQVDHIKIFPEHRRLDLRWSVTKEKNWECISLDKETQIGQSAKCFIQLRDITIDSPIEQIAINSSDSLYILKNSEINKYLVNLLGKLNLEIPEDLIVISRIVTLLSSFFYYKNIDKVKIEEILEQKFENPKFRDISRLIWAKIDKGELVSVILKTNFVKYDTTVWYRRLYS